VVTTTCVVWCRAGEEWIVDLLSVHQLTNTADTDTDTSANEESSLLQTIHDNFTVAAQFYSADVGGLFWVESLQLHAAFFLFNDVTDANRKARNRLPSGPQVHKCDIETVCFDKTHFGRSSLTAFERQREVWNLCSFLAGKCIGPVYILPSEQLLCVDSGVSVCDQIRQRFLTTLRSTAISAAGTKTPASLVFLRRTNSAVVVHSQLLRRVMEYARNELLTARRDVFIVTDVGHSIGLSTLQGVLDLSSRSGVDMTVHAGAKPLFSPISCVVIVLQVSSK